jgi:hypothetical protein
VPIANKISFPYIAFTYPLFQLDLEESVCSVNLFAKGMFSPNMSRFLYSYFSVGVNMSQGQSQESDFLPSLYEGDTGQLTDFTPSNPLITPTNSILGSCPIEGSEPDFLRPSNLPPPDLFTRVGPDRRKAFVLYNSMTHTDWVDWWLQTDFGQKSNLKWDTNRNSDIWSHFDQVAACKDGAPKVMCKNCARILEHPASILPNGRSLYGTSTLLKHLKTAACQKVKANRKEDISQFLISEVCSLFTIIYLILTILGPNSYSVILTNYMGDTAIAVSHLKSPTIPSY